ncbi:MAG: tRNA (adenosine(37)-N6)-dimethylallyltransferase MiaA [Bacteroidetes bacterium]|nr:tRNA (adenosine(37)-N6)-dimethylallyltransferase MiaA [Bacteroidota bacterium]
MKTLIVIGGATASGKTAVSIQLAKHFHTEILSADSRQCYRELNIGVAKPTQQQLQEVPHHFINSHSIEEDVSAGVYERYGLEILRGIFEKNDYAICVGGTGLYIKALCEGIDEMPAVNRVIEQEILTHYETLGLEWLQNEVKQSDKAFFESSENMNPNRLLRALIFIRSTGQSIRSFRKHTGKRRNFAIQYFAIDLPREDLYEKINTRVDEMMTAGLLEEVVSLVGQKHLRALQTVGYAELFAHLQGTYTLAEAVSKIKQHTRNYAKRQITWFRHQSDFQLIAPDYENIIKALKT